MRPGLVRDELKAGGMGVGQQRAKALSLQHEPQCVGDRHRPTVARGIVEEIHVAQVAGQDELGMHAGREVHLADPRRRWLGVDVGAHRDCRVRVWVARRTAAAVVFASAASETC